MFWLCFYFPFRFVSFPRLHICVTYLFVCYFLLLLLLLLFFYSVHKLHSYFAPFVTWNVSCLREFKVASAKFVF